PAARGRAIARSALGVLLEELDGIADGQDGLRRIIGNLAAEFFLEGHHELDGVKRVGAQIVDEARPLGDLVGLDAQMFHDDLLHPVADVTHLLNLVRFKTTLTDEPTRGPLCGASWFLAAGAKKRAAKALKNGLTRSAVSPQPGGLRLSYFKCVD